MCHIANLQLIIIGAIFALAARRYRSKDFQTIVFVYIFNTMVSILLALGFGLNTQLRTRRLNSSILVTTEDLPI